MITPAMMNEELTGAFWKKGATTDAVKIILPVSVRMSAARFFSFSVSSDEKYRITCAAICQFLSPPTGKRDESVFDLSARAQAGEVGEPNLVTRKPWWKPKVLV